MRVALGFKAHSGWAALVALGEGGRGLEVVDRRRVELVETGPGGWRQPYHAAENLETRKAEDLVKRAVAGARRAAVREMRAAVLRAREAGHEAAACAVLVGTPMPRWSVAEILAVHFRMHKAEGVLFRDVLSAAAKACRVRVVEVPEKSLRDAARHAMGAGFARTARSVAALGKSVGAPWGRDQKDAALAALVALRGRSASKSKLNRAWHEKNRMPPRASRPARLAWHRRHAKACGCRPIPASLLAARGT